MCRGSKMFFCIYTGKGMPLTFSTNEANNTKLLLQYSKCESARKARPGCQLIKAFTTSLFVAKALRSQPCFSKKYRYSGKPLRCDNNILTVISGKGNPGKYFTNGSCNETFPCSTN